MPGFWGSTSRIAAILQEIVHHSSRLFVGYFALKARGYKQVDILKGRTRFDVWAQPRTFCLFTHPVYGPQVVSRKERKNWVAFFFSPIWHLVTRTRHGLWLLVARVALALLGAVVIGAIIADGGYDAEAIAVGVYILFQLVDFAVSFIWLFKANTFPRPTESGSVVVQL